MVSLVNKMLNDLEKRDAFLYEKENTVLNGLYSAYDVELNTRQKSHSLNVVLIISLFLVAVGIASYHLLDYEFGPEPRVASHETIKQINISQTMQQTATASTPVKDNAEELVATKPDITPIPNLKLDESLFIETQQEIVEANSILGNKLNRIEDIYLERNDNEISLVMQMPEDIDYLVYGLSNPSRVVVEINQAELGFPLEQFEPIEPIVAVRYSINKDNRFKLVLESEQSLQIRKSISNQQNNKHNLVVQMHSAWQDDPQQEQAVISQAVDHQVQTEKEIVFKGELTKNWVNKNSDAYSDNLFKAAYAAYQSGDVTKSLKQLNRVLDQNPLHVNARSTLALILSKQGHNELAYSILNEGLIQNPEQTDWIKVYARLLLGEEKVLEAKQVMLRHTPEITNHTEYFALLSAIMQKLNQHDESARLYRNLLQINPAKSVWWMGLGISLESLKRYQDALYAYQKAYNNPALATESRQFVMQRISQLTGLIKDESS